MEIREIEKTDYKESELLRVFVEGILLGNGEIIRYGNSLGFEKKGVYVVEE